MAWILRLVKAGAEGDGQSTDVVEINKPDDLGDIATLADLLQLRPGGAP